MSDNRRIVEKIIETDPVIKKGLQRGIINSRALARFLQKNEGVDSSDDAILGVIRRFPLTNDETTTHSGIFKDCELVMRSKVGNLDLEIGQDVMKRIGEFASSIKATRGENLKVIVGSNSIRVIADQKALGQLRESFRDQQIVEFYTDLVELTVVLSPETSRKGVISRIASELALNDIPVHGNICSCSEVALLIAENDAPRAYEVMQKMLSETVPA